MAIFKNGILINPINDVINELDNNITNNIILFGCPGTGKSTVLSEYIERPSLNRLIINGSLKYGEFIQFKDDGVYKLYHVCLIVQKMIMCVESQFEEYKLFFSLLKNNIKHSLMMIDALYCVDIVESKDIYIDEKLVKNPELLLNSFFDIAFQLLGYKNITLIIDDFDKVGDSSRKYQEYLYNLLKNYIDVNIIFSVSDKNIDRKRLEKDHKIVDVNYAYDIEVLKNLFDMQFRREAYLTGIVPSKFFEDEVFEKLIYLTNGNISEMNSALRYFYQSDMKIPNNMYYYIENILYKDPVISGSIKRDRKLHI